MSEAGAFCACSVVALSRSPATVLMITRTISDSHNFHLYCIRESVDGSMYCLIVALFLEWTVVQSRQTASNRKRLRPRHSQLEPFAFCARGHFCGHGDDVGAAGSDVSLCVY